MKDNLIFWGGSHAKRLVFKAKELKLNEKYNILDFTKPGARIKETLTPNFGIYKETDTCFIQIFGNSAFKKNIKTTRDNNKKIIHLTKFEPQNSQVLRSEYEYLLEKVKNAKCKIVLIDNFYRHLFCCEEHHDQRTAPYQRKLNIEMKKFFEDYPRIIFIEHLKYLNFSNRFLKNTRNYSKLLPDTVHFKPPIYTTLLKNLIKTLGL